MSILKRLYHASVWSPNGVSTHDWRFRGLYRFVLPLTDLLFLWFGIVGWSNGIQSVEDAAGNVWQTTWSLLVGVAAFVCLVGVAFPRLWVIEFAGKVALISLVSAYIALYLGRGVIEPKVTATAGLILILILVPVWRVGDLQYVARQRKISKQADE